MRSTRLAALVVVAGALVAVLVLDPAPRRSGGGADGFRSRMPVAGPASELSATWFCAGGTGTPDGPADHRIVLANPTERDRPVTVTVLGGEVAPPLPSAPEPGAPGSTTSTPATSRPAATSTTTAPVPEAPAPVSRSVTVPARARVDLRLGDVLAAPIVSAVVEVPGGGVVVEHTVVGKLGVSSAPCLNQAATEWSFAVGSTARGNRELLVFMNPYPEPATLDIDFATDEGVRSTRRFEGFPVPARSVVAAYVDEDVARKDSVSALVRLRSGRLVVDRILSFDGTDGRKGLVVSPGVPRRAQVWSFPDGVVAEGDFAQIAVFNPGGRVAEAEVEVRPQDVSESGLPEPFELSIPPGRSVTVSLHDEDRVPRDSRHSVVVRSLNGVGVVAEQVVWAVDPSARRGVGVTAGSPLAGRRWLMAAGSTGAGRDELVTVVNPGESPAKVRIVGYGGGQQIGLGDLSELVVPAQGRVTVRLGEWVQRSALPLTVASDRAVVVARGLYRDEGVGIIVTLGVPVDDGTLEALGVLR